MIDGIGTTTYGYNPIAVPSALGAGQLASIDAPVANDTITFNYEQLGRVTNRSVNGTANSETWTFDSLGRVSTDVNKLGTFTNTYVGVTNRLSKIAYPGGASANYLYFPNSGDKRLQQIKNLNNNNNASKQLISQQDYTYDAEGEIVTWTKNYAGLSTPQRFDLGYDNADQLTTAPLKNASTSALIKQYTYGYDTASNRTSETVATTTTTSTPNNVNEITSQSGGVNRTLTYDLNGSITSDGATRTFEWDGANRLVAINYTGFTTRSEFTYDGLSRVAKIVEKTGSTINSTRKFVWHGNEMVEFRDATDAVTQRNYPQGQYVGTTAYFYTRDHLGSIREMFTGGGTVVARYDYDPFGRSTTLLGTTPTDFNFTGLYRHSKSNLDLAMYRTYDADLGRWTNRDPVAENGGLNLFAYCGQQPVILTDPSGLLTSISLSAPPDVTFPVTPSVGLAGGLGAAIGLAINVAAYDYETRVEADVARAQAQANRQRIDQQKRERDRYHNVCDEPAPPNLTGCALLRWKLERAMDCVAIRQAYMRKWSDTYAGHSGEILKKMWEIQKLQEQIRRDCTPCP